MLCDKHKAACAATNPIVPDRQMFATGAVRGTDRNAVRYDLIPLVGLRRLATTCAEGAAKYGPNNWQKGIPSDDLMNHAVAHLVDYLRGDRSEDHLAHAAWNLFVVMHNEECRPDMHCAYTPIDLGAGTVTITADPSCGCGN